MQGMELVFGKESMARVRAARVLVIGAGGIGSELLKNLVMSGFRDIEVIDLDTIEVSNLNRQFLFRRRHVGMSKAKVAIEEVLSFIEPRSSNGSELSKDVSELSVSKETTMVDDSEDKERCIVKMKGHLGNVKSSEFGQEFVSGFDLVLNALDNVSARRHVNRLCLSLGKPFVESGTRGFFGQTLPVVPDLTACWECTPKDNEQKSYAVCTIRSTPDQPVHCIVWAKMLFALMFGPQDSHSDIKDLRVERRESEAVEDYAARMAEYLFRNEIEEQLSMKDKWKKRDPPKPLDFAQLLSDKSTKMKKQVSSLRDYSTMNVLSVSELIDIFKLSVIELDHQYHLNGHMDFDKDRATMMSFVSSAANLRMHCYHITMQSEFKNKGIAGNIVHAIATSNAIVSAHIIVEAISILSMSHFIPMSMLSEELEKKTTKAEEQQPSKKQTEKKKFGFSRMRESGLQYGWLSKTGPKWMLNQVVERPNPECAVCQHMPQHLILDLSSQCNRGLMKTVEIEESKESDSVDKCDEQHEKGEEIETDKDEEQQTSRWIVTFGEFRERILIKYSGMIDPSVTVECAEDVSKSRFIESRAEADDDESDDSSEGEPLNYDELPLTHGAIGFANGVIVRAMDSAQDVTLEWIIHDRPLDEETYPDGFAVVPKFNPLDFPLLRDDSNVTKPSENSDKIAMKPRIKKRKAGEMEETSVTDSDVDMPPSVKRSKV